MPRYFKLRNPDITAVSVDGIEHTINEWGLLEVEHVTPNLVRELKTNFGAIEWDEELERQNETAQAQAAKDEAERQDLFAKLDAHFGRQLDRRRSLKQLRRMMDDVQAKQRPPQLAVVNSG